MGRTAANLGARRALLVSDPGVMAAGWTEAVRRSLDAAGLAWLAFSDVTPNPRVDQVAAGAAAYRAGGCNAIVVVGGGSPVDCAKGIGIVTANGGAIADYDGFDRVRIHPAAGLRPHHRRRGGRRLAVRHPERPRGPHQVRGGEQGASCRTCRSSTRSRSPPSPPASPRWPGWTP